MIICISVTMKIARGGDEPDVEKLVLCEYEL